MLKLTAFCNLNCSYCYMFNLADRTYDRVPRCCETETAKTAVELLAEHARRAGRSAINVVLHGGEPLLWPADRFAALFESIGKIRSSGLAVSVSLQTNGLVVPAALLTLLAEHDVTLGFSLDGPEAVNDQARVGDDGKGSYRRVLDSMRQTLDRGFPPSRIGVLSVVNPAMRPIEYFEWAIELPVRNLSLLWPIEFSWDSPPWDPGEEQLYRQRPRYGVWMAAAFREWWDRWPEQIHVRQFLYTVGRLIGQAHHSDSIGNDFVDMFVVNTDGGIEYPDYLRAHRDGGSRTPYSVHRDDLDDLRANDPTFRTLLRLRESIPAECRGCQNEDVCGGGFLAGRVTHGGFAPETRSVLCHDQMYYFNVVRSAIQPYLAAMEEVEAGGRQ
ncbi:MAG: radical SAM protein [Acidobacteria bacterium]|nr:radical SAM protein [Acidobacteriota bacterium]